MRIGRKGDALSAPEDHHAREHDDRDDDHADGETLPALLKAAFVLGKIEILILKLVHLGAYYTKTDYKIFLRFSRWKS